MEYKTTEYLYNMQNQFKPGDRAWVFRILANRTRTGFTYNTKPTLAEFCASRSKSQENACRLRGDSIKYCRPINDGVLGEAISLMRLRVFDNEVEAKEAYQKELQSLAAECRSVINNIQDFLSEKLEPTLEPYDTGARNCNTCALKCTEPDYINTTCLGCRHQYTGQEAFYRKPDLYVPSQDTDKKGDRQ